MTTSVWCTYIHTSTYWRQSACIVLSLLFHLTSNCGQRQEELCHTSLLLHSGPLCKCMVHDLSKQALLLDIWVDAKFLLLQKKK